MERPPIVEGREAKVLLLTQALVELQQLTENDPSLVKGHGYVVTEEEIGTPLTPEAYNFRMLGNAQQIAEAVVDGQFKRARIGCMDRRVSEPMQNEDPVDLLILNAGGGAQPTQDRFIATVNLVGVLLQVNEDIIVDVTGHTGVCGGANHFRGGDELKQMNPQDEQGAMSDYMEKLRQELADRQVDMDRVMVGLALVKENVYQETDWSITI